MSFTLYYPDHTIYYPLYPEHQQGTKRKREDDQDLNEPKRPRTDDGKSGRDLKCIPIKQLIREAAGKHDMLPSVYLKEMVELVVGTTFISPAFIQALRKINQKLPNTSQ